MTLFLRLLHICNREAEAIIHNKTLTSTRQQQPDCLFTSAEEVLNLLLLMVWRQEPMQLSDCESDLSSYGRSVGVINHMVLISDGSPLWQRNVHVIQFGTHRCLKNPPSIQCKFIHTRNSWNWTKLTALICKEQMKSQNKIIQIKRYCVF